MQYHLEGKIFQSLSNTENGDVNAETLFHYFQNGEIISAEYSGGAIIEGHLLGKMLPSGQLDFRYHHINTDGHLMVGKCISTPSLLPDGRLKLTEHWQWLSGDRSTGRSEVIEIDSV